MGGNTSLPWSLQQEPVTRSRLEVAFIKPKERGGTGAQALLATVFAVSSVSFAEPDTHFQTEIFCNY
jgi:hypothetical protein